MNVQCIYACEALLAAGLLIAVFWGPVPKWNTRNARLQVADIAETARAAERALLAPLTAALTREQPDQTAYDYFVKKLFAAIDYAVKRHDWFEDQRSRIFQTTLTLLSAVLAVVAIIAKVGVNKPLPLILLITAAGTSIVFVKMAWLYSKELNADRPYRLVSDVVFWFFRYNLPSTPMGGFTAETAKAAATKVLEERKRFFDRVTEHFPLFKSVREDIEQLFILQVLQHYKSESLTKMQWLLNYFIIFACLQVTVLTLIEFKS
jgi:hypothetical protein